MTEQLGVIHGPIKFGCDPKGRKAGVTLRFNVETSECNPTGSCHKNHRLVLGYQSYWQMLLASGVQDVQNLESHKVIVEVTDDGRMRFARLGE